MTRAEREAARAAQWAAYEPPKPALPQHSDAALARMSLAQLRAQLKIADGDIKALEHADSRAYYGRAPKDVKEKLDALSTAAYRARARVGDVYAEKLTPKPTAPHGPLDQHTSSAVARVRADPAWAERQAAGRGDKSDALLRLIQAERGFDTKPTLATKKEIDAAVAAGAPQLFHGFGNPARAVQFQSGEFHSFHDFPIGTYNDTSRHLSGFYLGVGESPKLARYYAGMEDGKGGAVVRMALKADARVAEYRAIEREWKAARAADRERVAAAQKQSAERAVQARAIHDLIYSDMGRYAAWRGYDIIVSTDHHWVLLNRNAVLVQRSLIQKRATTGSGSKKTQ